MTRALLTASAALALLAAAPAFAQTDPLASLSPEKRAFLSDEAMLAKLALTPAKVRIALAGRPATDADAYATALMALVEDAKFKAGRDMAEVPLNPKARGYNAGTTLRPPELDSRKRDPGPFSLDRYMFQKGGIPTFAHAPIALRTTDLVAGKVDVAFVGIPLDLSSGWRDAKHAPEEIRAADGLVGADADAGIDPSLVLNLADYGNLSVDNMAAERSMDHVRLMIRDMAKAGTIPFIVGGDHALMFPDVAAMADVYGVDTLTLVQFDAHPEATLDGDHFISDVQSLTRLLAGGLVRPERVIQVGVRGRDADPATEARLRKAGVTTIGMATIAAKGADGVAADLGRGIAKAANVFVSFDMSVLDPAAASAAGRPVPGGLTMREAIPMVRNLCASTKVVGFELLDAAPIMDPTYVSTLSANYILHACLSGIALHRSGQSRTSSR